MIRLITVIVLFIITFTKLQAQENVEYCPFVKLYREWYIYEKSDDVNKRTPRYYFTSSEERENGMEYYPFHRRYNRNDDSVVGLLREEERKVYMYDTISNIENLIYDFSLNEGDVFTYNYGLNAPIKCKVLQLDEYKDGPILYNAKYDEVTDEITEYSRYLYTWTIGVETAPDVFTEATTWIEAAGGLHGPLADACPNTESRSLISYTAYLDDNWSEYLPFMFHDSISNFRGMNFEINHIDEDIHKIHYPDLSFELHDDTLRIKGCLVSSCGSLYAFLHEEPTDNPDTTRIVLNLNSAGVQYYCEELYETDMSITGFDPNKKYIIRYGGTDYLVTNANMVADAIKPTITTSRRMPVSIYNLQGQRISHPQRGLNIVGGRKVLITK